MSVILTVAVVLGALLACRHVIRRLRSRGPIGLPLLGSLPYMVYKMVTDRTFRWYLFINDDLRRSYGDVVSVVIGTQEFVVISGYQKIKAALVDRGDVFSNRPNHPMYQSISKGHGLVYSEGQLWQDQRRFALRVLRDFGLGRSLSEQQIQVEAQELVRHLGDSGGGEIDVKIHVTKAVVNVIGGLVFAQRSGHEDPKLIEFLAHTRVLTQANWESEILAFYPQIPLSIAAMITGSDSNYLKSEQWITDYCRDKIQAIERNYEQSSEPNCFVEAYLREQRQRVASGDGVGFYEDFQLVRTVFDLYLAGSDTTTTTLRWALLFCSFNPEVQEACHREISANIGARVVCMKDRRAMHRVQAFLDETQRLSNLVPLSVEHRASEETVFDGVLISPSCIILPNLYSVLMDPELFPEPHVFNPDRFIDAETGTYKPSDYLIPFSIGRRSCLGETLARMELFLFFVTLVQHFRFEPSDASRRRRDEILLGYDGIVRAPGDHTLVVHKRKL